MGGGADHPPGPGEHLLRRAEGAEVVAPGLAGVGPAAHQGPQQGGGGEQAEGQGIAVHDQDPQAEAGDQQAPLQLHVVAAEPGVLLHRHQLGLAVAPRHRALPSQRPGQLGHERERTDAAPELVAQHHTHQDQGQAQIPEQIGAQPVAADGNGGADLRPTAVAADGQQGQGDQPEPAQQQGPAPQSRLPFRPGVEQVHRERSGGVEAWRR